MLNGFTRTLKPLDILTEDQVQAIHRGALDVLWQTGIRLENKKALKLLADHGCKVDYDAMTVRFPPGLVEECLRKCPSGFRIKARDPEKDLVLGGNTVYFLPFPGRNTVDPDTWETRRPTRKEFYEAVTVLDALDNVHAMYNFAPYHGFAGVPEVMNVLEGVAGQIRNFSKAIAMAGRPYGAEVFTIKLAQSLGIDIGGGMKGVPPFTFQEDQVQAAMRLAEAGLVTYAENIRIMGSTGPATLAGSAVSGNAEGLAQIVVSQLVNPGTKMWALGFTFPQDMRAGAPVPQPVFGAVGSHLSQLMFGQIWRDYGIPVYTSVAGSSSSKTIDYQAGYEKALGALTAVLSGAHLIALCGSMGSANAFHPLQAILDDDIAGMMGRFMQGVEVTDETLAIDLINRVGHAPGFFEEEHTKKWSKLEQYVPSSADWLTYPEWMEQGKKSALDYAKERMETILATHEPLRLSLEQEQIVDDVLQEARDFYRKKGMISDAEWAEYQKVMGSKHHPYL
jgi:trimethylamine---corrinoid protein Co-methyltransferase